jgi:hypothetical protein
MGNCANNCSSIFGKDGEDQEFNMDVRSIDFYFFRVNPNKPSSSHSNRTRRILS